MISNRCARKSLLINCNSIISKNYLRFLVDNNETKILLIIIHIIVMMRLQKMDLLNQSKLYQLEQHLLTLSRLE